MARTDTSPDLQTCQLALTFAGPLSSLICVCPLKYFKNVAREFQQCEFQQVHVHVTFFVSFFMNKYFGTLVFEKLVSKLVCKVREGFLQKIQRISKRRGAI